MPKKTALSPARPAIRNGHFLGSHVALIVHSDGQVASRLKEVLENVACDWRIVQAGNGAEAARYVMNKELPDFFIVGTGLARVTAADLAEWIRSFGRDYRVPILVYGEPGGDEEREQLLRNEAEIITPKNCSQETLAARLAQIVARTEKFHLAPLSAR